MIPLNLPVSIAEGRDEEHIGGKKRRNPGGGELVINTLSLLGLSLACPAYIFQGTREKVGREGPFVRPRLKIKEGGGGGGLRSYEIFNDRGHGRKVGIIGNGAKTMMNGRGIDERNINSNARVRIAVARRKRRRKKLFCPWNTDKRNALRRSLPATRTFSSLPLLSSPSF